MQLFEFEDNFLHFISFIVVQGGMFQNIKGRFNFWLWGLFLALIKQFFNWIFEVIAFSYFKSGCYNMIT